MQISYTYLSRFFRKSLPSPRDLAYHLLMIGVECESVEEVEDEKGKDTLLHLKITPNRGDLLSYMGIARELSVSLKLPRKENFPFLLPPLPRTKKSFPIQIENKEDLFRYGVLSFQILEKPLPLPEEWQRVLLRSNFPLIHPLVDLTNLVLILYGQPLHLFDREKVEGKIVIRRSREGEKIVTLDGVFRTCTGEELLIADLQKPLAIGGVIGGEESKVREESSSFLLESAHFSPRRIMRSRKAQNLSTESSYRFERGVDFMGVETGIRAFLYGLQKITRGKFRIDGMTITGKRMKKIVIPWKEKDSEKVLGFSIPSSEAKRILTALGLKKEKRGYIVPSYRTDLKEFPDLVEEVARIYGYEKIPTTLPLPPSEVKEDPFFTYKETLRQFLIHLGFLEGTHTSFSHESSGVEILNPLSQDRGYLRRSLLPGLISAGVLNHTTGEENLRLFEMGTVFLPEEKQVQETVSLGIVLSGKRFPYSWSKPERVDFYDLKGVLEQILSFLRLFIPPSLPPVRFQPVDHEWLEEGSSYEILWESKKEVVLGICGKCTEKILRKKKYEMEGKIDPPPRLLSPLWLMEISLSELFPLWKTFASFPSFRPFSRYPFVEWDLSLLVPKEVKSEEILKVIHEKKPRELQEFWIFDRYEGEGVPESFLSIGVRLRFQSEERTLSLEEVKEWVHRIKENLPSLGITLRYEFTPEGKPVS